MPKAHSQKKGNAQRNTAVGIALILLLLLLLFWGRSSGCGTSCGTSTTTSTYTSTTSTSTSTVTTTYTTTSYSTGNILSICGPPANLCSPSSLLVSSKQGTFNVNPEPSASVSFYPVIQIHNQLSNALIGTFIGTPLTVSWPTPIYGCTGGITSNCVIVSWSTLPSGSYRFDAYVTSDPSGMNLISNVVETTANF